MCLFSGCLVCLSKFVASTSVRGLLDVYVRVYVCSSGFVCALILFMCPGQWLRRDRWG